MNDPTVGDENEIQTSDSLTASFINICHFLFFIFERARLKISVIF